MKSFATLTNLFTSLSQNTAATNTTLGQQLMNDQHRFLIQKYFDNERTYQTTTIGAATLATTAVMASGDTSATLTASWSYATVTQLVNFSNSNQRSVLFTKGSTAISWAVPLSASATTAITTVGVQAYPIPAIVSKIKNDTITVGQLRFVPAPIQTRAEWDLINTLPYTSDIPNYFFIYNNNVEFWPIPSTTGNIISFNYKARMADFSTAFLFSSTAGAAYSASSAAFDYQVGSLSGLAVGGTSITGSSTSWNTTGKFPLNTDVTFYRLYLTINAPYGDGIWYPIQSFQSDTALTLLTPLQTAPSSTAASTQYSIGQLPALSEDFHDMIPYGALKTYFSSINPNPSKFGQFEALYGERHKLLEDYAGTKTVNVDLGPQNIPRNANLFIYGQS